MNSAFTKFQFLNSDFCLEFMEEGVLNQLINYIESIELIYFTGPEQQIKQIKQKVE